MEKKYGFGYVDGTALQKKGNKGKPFYFVLVNSSTLSFKNILRKLHNDFTEQKSSEVSSSSL